MSDTLFNIKQIIALIVFIIAFSLMGMMTGQPIMVIFYAGVIALASGITFLIIRTRQRHSEVSQKSNPIPKRIFGGFLAFLALITPLLVVLYTNLMPITIEGKTAAIVYSISIILGITILFMALFALAVYLINYLNKLAMRVLGYLVVILASLIPGLVISLFDKTASTIGAVYYVALAVLILGYNGINLLIAKD